VSWTGINNKNIYVTEDEKAPLGKQKQNGAKGGADEAREP